MSVTKVAQKVRKQVLKNTTSNTFTVRLDDLPDIFQVIAIENVIARDAFSQFACAMASFELILKDRTRGDGAIKVAVQKGTPRWGNSIA